VSVASRFLSSSGVRLAPAAPHPLRGGGTFAFELPAATRVELALFDLAGRLVKSLIAGEPRTAGRHTVAIDTSKLAPGVYLARLRTGLGDAQQRTVVLGR